MRLISSYRLVKPRSHYRPTILTKNGGTTLQNEHTFDPSLNVASFWSIFIFAYDTASIILHGRMKQH